MNRTMATEKWLGIWMDHSNFHLVEFSPGQYVTRAITTEFIAQDNTYNLNFSGSNMPYEQQRQTSYFENLVEVIRNYKKILLFGPSDVKLDLFNLLRSDPLFSEIEIDMKHADEMTSHQEHAFVNAHFSTKSNHQNQFPGMLANNA